MARIRSIKPEFWTSEQVVECSTNARLLFIGLWNFCDDMGRHSRSPKQIKALVFPADDFSVADIEKMLVELENNTLIASYTVDLKRYFEVTGWHHQKIDKPQPAKCPPRPKVAEKAIFDDHSTTIPGIVSTERIGKEGIGKDRKEDELSASARPNRDFQKLERELRQAAGCENNPSAGLSDLSTIIGLLDQGADFADEILSAIAARPKPDARSWKWFVPQIQQFRANRKAAAAGTLPEARAGPNIPGKPYRQPPPDPNLQALREMYANDSSGKYVEPQPYAGPCIEVSSEHT